MTERTVQHASFVIERTYPVPVEAVWHALSDNDARDQWFSAGPAFDTDEKSHEFRVGGHATDGPYRHLLLAVAVRCLLDDFLSGCFNLLLGLGGGVELSRDSPDAGSSRGDREGGH